jgi:hypothetical protein
MHTSQSWISSCDQHLAQQSNCVFSENQSFCADEVETGARSDTRYIQDLPYQKTNYSKSNLVAYQPQVGLVQLVRKYLDNHRDESLA